MTQDEMIAKLTEMLEIQQKLHETAIDMLKPAIEAERERMTVVAMNAAEKAVDVAIKLEREACAKVCDDYDVAEDVNTCDTAEGIAIAIRARGQA